MKKISTTLCLLLFIVGLNAQTELHDRAFKITNSNELYVNLKSNFFYHGTSDGVDITTKNSPTVLGSGSDLIWGAFYQAQPYNPGLFTLTSVSANGFTPCFRVRANGNVGIFNSTPSYALEVGTAGSGKIVRVNGVTVHTSDERFKENINTIPNSLGQLKELKGVSYYFKQLEVKNEIPEKIRETSTEEELTQMQAELTKLAKAKSFEPKRTHYGFLAQNVEKIFPDLVYKDDEGILSIDYIGLIPVLVNALNEQQQQIEYLMTYCNTIKTNDSYKSNAALLEDDTNNEQTVAGTAYLEQNTPNPFNQSTQINYYLPESIQTAYLCFYDLQGKQLKQIKLTQRNKGSEIISASQFSAGMYIYTLIADGKEIDTKRMILTQ